MNSAPTAPALALAGLWGLAGLPPAALQWARLLGCEPAMPSSFAVSTAAQSTVAAAALAACELGHLRGLGRQTVEVDMTHAAVEATGWFSVDGVVPSPWDAFSGLYRARDGWVRVHANFRHHRDGALGLLGLSPGHCTRADAERAMRQWDALDFESAAAERGLVATAMRRFDEWDASTQGQAVAALPLIQFERLGDAPPLDLPALAPDAPPLEGVRVLDFTRILAGPVGTRTLAQHGADVLLINAPHLPNIDALADTSRGKRSAHLDLRDAAQAHTLRGLLQGAHVMVQGYRPGGLAALGFGAQDAAAARPGLVYVSLCAYGDRGPWAARRGFDSLVQTAMGFNDAEGQAAGDGQPRALPMQILDEATGFLIAMGAAAALHRQQREGGSWHVKVALAATGQWVRALGRVVGGLSALKPDPMPWATAEDSGFGWLRAVRHSARLGRSEPPTLLPSRPPGSDAAQWS